MLETYFRPAYQKFFVDPLAKCLVKYLSPNSTTLLACLIGIAAAPALICHYSILACGLLLISGYFDTLDGTLARLSKRISMQGSVFDIVSDRVVEVAIIFGLYGVDPSNRGWLALGMLGSIFICVTTFLVIGIFIENSSNKGFYYSPGLIERTEAFIFFIAMILVPGYFNILAIVFIFLVLVTIYLHLYQFFKKTKLLVMDP